MSNKIQLLPDALANQIAAGEVIQRPASVIKESLENSVDAGATSIQVIITNAGKTLLQIVDNGAGMSVTDARMCFEKHATSKIQNIDDLFAIKTMGFRGEALASIAAIAQVDLKTKQADHEIGTRIVIEGSEVKSQEPVACPNGTSLSVKNLFYNVPARRKFLKSDPIETRHILEEFQRIALGNPNISFSLHHNKEEVFNVRAGTLKQRIIELFGKSYNEGIVELLEETDYVIIQGYLGKPNLARKSRGGQYFFVNNRFIKSGYLHHALTTAFEGLIPPKHHPFYVIFLQMDPAKIDVNVHPSKQEIKFEDERLIYSFLHTIAKRTLGIHHVIPPMDFEKEAFIKDSPFSRMINKNEQSSGGFAGQSSFPAPNRPGKGWENVLTTATDWSQQKASDPESYSVTLPSKGISSEEQEDFDLFSGQTDIRPVQIHKKYFMIQIRSGMVLIEQRSAHERILYERFLQSIEGQSGASQQLLFPETLSFSTTDAQMIQHLLPLLNQLGYDIEVFGASDFIVRGVPSFLTKVNVKEMLEQLLEQYKLDTGKMKQAEHHAVALAMAKSGAIQTGTAMQAEEMKTMVDQLFACKTPYISPTGKLTFVVYSLDELEQLFAKK